ncbi:MAG: hypothetical protein FRX48_09593 [Lasallia pustulata]|uniref:Man(5)GlcNAc(2)-PP-dolichol translocation protein RFT1 n=1 Tax=Lasallia pustulata TaxID=136370 RepID=A0A5M8PBN7_9LECA|nr:MAG: hypothetical protein FRX48_09593 [Lasallia pustulata]
MSKPISPRKLDKATRTSQTVLSNSARGATFLILLQIGSRALTFFLNQVLLRYLSPELLGISTQLELYTISVLYFARESLRVALQRQRSDAVPADVNVDHVASGKNEGEASGRLARSYATTREAQEVVNLSYIAIALGVPLAYGLGQLYLRNAEPMVLAAPYFHESLYIYTLATLIELSAEPCFAVASQQMLYGTRASAEASATFTRCILTCSAAIWASRNQRDIGVLPFAIGQISYASVLCLIYYTKIWPISSRNRFSMLLKPISTSNPNQYILTLFSRPLISLTSTLSAQSGLKHLLTQGDSLLLATLTPLTSQGTYALASNYGGLLARMLFQPIEESSRGLFGRLLSPIDPSSSTTTTTNPSSTHPNPNPSPLTSAHTYLLTLLRLYSLLTLLILPLGAPLAPPLLRLLLGPRWTSPATASVLAAYCHYIPLLAVNGILEAFVAAVASPPELRRQSLWMLAFSAGFAGAAWLLLGVWGMGAKGMVVANALNLGMRIWWSAGVGDGWGGGVGGGGDEVAGEGVWWRVGDLVKGGVVAAGYGVLLLFLERKFLLQCYQMLRPPKDESKKKI